MEDVLPLLLHTILLSLNTKRPSNHQNFITNSLASSSGGMSSQSLRNAFGGGHSNQPIAIVQNPITT